jgi:hypothetical protein
LPMNPNAIHILEQNLDKVHWDWLSANPNAIHILEQNLDKVDWELLSENPNAIHILEQNLDKVHWDWLSTNPNAIHLLLDYDYELIKKSKQELSKEIIEYVFHPLRLIRISNAFGMEMEQYLEIL